MVSFFNIEKIHTLLAETAGSDKYADSMLKMHGSGNSIRNCVEEACRNVEIRNETALLRAIAEGMADYLKAYAAPPSFRQKLWDSCNSWIQRIAAELKIEAGDAFEEQLPRPITQDLGVELVKALHAKEGKTKDQLSTELGVGKKTIQTELRALDPSLREKGEKIRPLRIAGQEMHAAIQYKSIPKAEEPRALERSFFMADRLHPIALQLNTQEVGTLLLSLYKWNEESGSILSREMALDIWCQLSPPGQERIREVFGMKDSRFGEFLDEITEELEDGRLISFHTEEEQRENMSLDELAMQSYKGGVDCMIEVRQNGIRKSLDRARIILLDGDRDIWLAIPSDEYPDQTNALEFTMEDVTKIR